MRDMVESDYIREYERRVINLRLACDAEIRALSAGRKPAHDMVIILEMGAVQIAHDGFRRFLEDRQRKNEASGGSYEAFLKGM